MKLTITTKTTLRQLILDKDQNLIEVLNNRRMTNNGVGYGILINWVSGTVYCETLIGDVVNVVTEGIPIHTLKTIGMDIAKLDNIWFEGDGEILVSFL